MTQTDPYMEGDKIRRRPGGLARPGNPGGGPASYRRTLKPQPMKSSKIIAAICAACFVTVAAFAADATGTWKWTQQGRNGAQEMTLKLDQKGDVLTGTVVGGQGPQGQMPDVAIADASVKDGTVSFTVTREFNGNKRTSKYTGKLDGDTIKGESERPGRDGAVQKSEWNATRAK